MKRLSPCTFSLWLISALVIFAPTGRAMEGAGGGESNPFSAVNGQAGANAFTGGGSVSIPIVVPPGRPLVTPSLALTYSSQGGMSPAGLGWGLSIGMVARDGKWGVPRCGGANMNDFNVSLNASSNVLFESSPGVYMQKIDEEYSKSIPDQNQNRWTVTNRSGMRYIFGESVASRVFTGGDSFYSTSSCSFTTEWHATSVIDPNGNSLRIQYEKTGNTPIPTQIDYGGNEDANIPHPYQILIESEDIQAGPSRTNKPLQRIFTTGVEQLLSKRIKSIIVRGRATANGSYNEIRRYTLHYDNDDASPLITQEFLLTSIETTGLPTKTFTYSASTPTLNSGWTGSVVNSEKLGENRDSGSRDVLMDLNADGIMDRLCNGSGGWNAAYGNPRATANTDTNPNNDQLFPEGAHCSSSSNNWTIPSPSTIGVDHTGNISRIGRNSGRTWDIYTTIDISGDGVPDLVTRDTSQGDHNIKVFLGSCTSPFQCGFASSAVVPRWNNPGPVSDEALIERSAGDRGTSLLKDLIDMNGDGRPDLLREDASNSWRIHFNTGSGFGPAVYYPDMDPVLGYWANPESNAEAERFLIDVNADGLPDWVSAPRSNAEETQTARIPNKYFTVSQSTGVLDGPYDIDDPNLGVLCRTQTSGQAVLCSKGGVSAAGKAIVGAMSVRLNTGSGFAQPVYSPAPFWRGGHYSATHLRGAGKDSGSSGNTKSWIFRDFADVNGDGRVDVVATGEAYGDGTTNWYYLPNLGDGRFGGSLVVGQTAAPGNFNGNDSVHLGVVRPALFVPSVGQYLGRTFSNLDDETDTTMTVLDIDGDGIGERVSAFQIPGNQWELKKFEFSTAGQKVKPYLLLVMKDGVGGVTQYDYKPGALFAGLQPDPASGIVGAGVPFPIWVVSALRKTDGLCPWTAPTTPADWGSTQTNWCLRDGDDLVQVFDYKKGAFDGPEREFRGFGEVTISDAPVGIGGVQRQSFYQDDYRKGKVQKSESFAGATTEPVVGRTTYDWQYVGSGVRKQVYLREQKVESFPVYSSGGASSSYVTQCVIHRNSIALTNGSPDPQTRIQSACSMACSGAGESSSGCDVNVVGQKTVETTYASPVGNSAIEIWDRPATLATHYRENPSSLKLTSETEFYYDGLGLGENQRGRLTRERQHLSTTPNEWSEKTVIYDDSNSIGPGNVTSVHALSSVLRDPQTTIFDTEFKLFPVSTTLPRTGPSSALVTHTISQTFDYRFGATTSTTGVLGASVGDVSGTTYDSLGRPTCAFEPGTTCAANGTGGVIEYRYQFGDPSASSTSLRLSASSVRRKEPNSPNGYLTSTTYWDALGRIRFTTNEQLKSDSGSIATAVVAHTVFGSNAKPWRSYEPYWLTGNLSLSPPNGLAAVETTYVLNGNAGGRLDPVGRVYRVTQFDGSNSATLFLGTTTEAYSPTGDLTRTVVDEHGRIVVRETFNQSSGAALTRSDAVYDGGDRVAEEWSGGDQSTKIIRTYDLAGRLVQTQDPDSGIWTKMYDIAGNVIFANDPKANQSVQTCYDQHDRVVLECGGSTDTYNPSLCASANPSCSGYYKYSYDETNNISGSTNQGKGRLTTVVGLQTTTKYLYDVRGRVTSQKDQYMGSIKDTSFAYRSDIDRLTKMWYPDGEIVKYGYDIAGQPQTLSQVNSSDQWLAWYVMDVKYDIRGRATFVQRGNQTTDSMTYHGASEGFRLATSRSERPSSGPTDPGDVFLNLSYDDYDANGRIKTITDQRWTTGPRSMTGAYQYDGAGRLLSSDVVGQRAASTPTASPETFQYNPIGNMTYKNGLAVAYGETGKPHRASSVLTSTTSAWGMAYDANGQRVAKSNNGSTEAYEYVYDAFGNLFQIKKNNTVVKSFGYDHMGQRVFETGSGGTRWFFGGKYSEGISSTMLLVKYYYLGGQLIATRADSAAWLFGAGAPPVAPLSIPPEWYWAVMSGAIVLLLVPIRFRNHRWVTRAAPSGALGGVLILIAAAMPLAFSTGCPGEAPIRQLHMGHLGGPLAISRTAGSVDRQLRYSAYGEVRRYDANGAGVPVDIEDRREYTSYDTDEASGLEYAGLRYYDPTVVTFTSHDPAEQLENPYSYVGWDPINRTDPTGAFVQMVPTVLEVIESAIQTAVVAGSAGAAYHAAQTGSAGTYFGDIGMLAANIASPIAFGIHGIVVAPNKFSSYVTGSGPNVLNSFVGDVETLATSDDDLALAMAGVGVAMTVLSVAYAVFDAAIPRIGSYRIGTVKSIFGTSEVYAQLDPLERFNISLLEHEFAGGHTVTLHVAKQLSFLRGRLNGEISAASSFYSLRQAGEVINVALNANAARINSWLASPKTWMTIESKMNMPTGYGVTRGVRGFSEPNGVFLVLRKGFPTREGFVVYTAFPVGVP